MTPEAPREGALRRLEGILARVEALLLNILPEEVAPGVRAPIADCLGGLRAAVVRDLQLGARGLRAVEPDQRLPPLPVGVDEVDDRDRGLAGRRREVQIARRGIQ